MSVLFSIAVHENQDCVHDMIENILWFCPESTIILHIAKGFDFTLEPKFNASVHINKLQYYTGFIDGTLVYVHLSNYRYATRINLNFSTFVPFGSNQMFIKKGFESYVNNFDCVGFPSYMNQSKGVTDKSHYPKFCKDFIFKGYFTTSDIYKMAPEGTYYSKYLIDDLLKHLDSNRYYKFSDKYIYRTKLGKYLRSFLRFISRTKDFLGFGFFNPSLIAPFSYANEEIIFPSLSTSNLNKGSLTCFIPWKRGKNIDVTISDVDHCLKNMADIYSVKRVPRDINNITRCYIKNISSDYK